MVAIRSLPNFDRVSGGQTMRTIRPTEILEYYDGVELFAGKDAIGGHYIGMRVEAAAQLDRYLVAGVSPELLRAFRSGGVDLRTLFVESPSDEWFITQANGEPEDWLFLEPQSGSLFETSFLPEEGYLLEDVLVDDLALQQARERGNVVFEFSVEPPEAAVQHRMRMTTLAGLLTHLQTVVKHAYKRAVRELTNEVRRQIDTTDAHVMDVVVPASAGSYRVILEAARPPDLFGSGELVRGLRRVDEVFASADNPDSALQILQAHQGHLAGAYIRLLAFLADHETGLRYGWADPLLREARYGGVSQGVARQLAESLSGVTSLTTETVILTGEFFKVNTSTGSWGLDTDDGRKTGRIDGESPPLAGLIAGTRYRFECMEEIRGDPIGGERHTLYLRHTRRV